MLFYDTLRDLRKEKGYTLREVATRSGVSAAYISQLENRHRGVPSPDVILKLSEGLNASYDDLMRAAGYLQPKEPAQPRPSAPVNLRRFLRDNELVFDGILLTDDDKEWIDRILTALFWKTKHARELYGESGTEAD